MPDLIDSTQQAKLSLDERRALDAVASFQRLVPRIQPDAALAITLTTWIDGPMSPFVVAGIARALVAAYAAENERRATDLQATTARIRAERAVSPRRLTDYPVGDDNECEGHESLAGEHMGAAVYCDGTCAGARRTFVTGNLEVTE